MASSSPGAGYLERLVRRMAGEAEVRAAYAGGPLAGGRADPYAELDLLLVASAAFRERLLGWMEPVGETAFLGAIPGGCRAITTDGLVINLKVAERREEADPGGMNVLFEREGATRAGEAAGPGGAAAGPEAVAPTAADPGALDREAASFWADLYRAAGAIGRGRVLSAHGLLEPCRARLLDLYRLALAPDRPGRGFADAEDVPGADRALERVLPWLVCPLEARAQWRCAHRLATTYESLMLPLCERLGLSYPYPMRNLAFQRLDAIKTRWEAARAPIEQEAEQEGAPEGAGAKETGAASGGPAAPEGSQRKGPARFRIKRRGR